MTASKDWGIEDLTRFAMEVIRSSGKKALSYYGKAKPGVKFDDELVTEAELSLMENFQNQLHTHFPDHQVFDGNRKHEGYTHEEKRYLWIYDPLDGVANFQSGIPIWGSSLSLLENFWPILGMFYMPSTDDLFYARVGQKAFLGKKQISISSQETINDESLLLTYSRFHHHYNSTFPGKIRDLGCTTAHICYVAMGCAEAAVIINESYQDLAAARVIIEAAGGKIFKMDGSDFLLDEYLDGQSINERLMVGASDMYSQIHTYLQEVG